MILCGRCRRALGYLSGYDGAWQLVTGFLWFGFVYIEWASSLCVPSLQLAELGREEEQEEEEEEQEEGAREKRGEGGVPRGGTVCVAVCCISSSSSSIITTTTTKSSYRRRAPPRKHRQQHQHHHHHPLASSSRPGLARLVASFSRSDQIVFFLRAPRARGAPPLLVADMQPWPRLRAAEAWQRQDACTMYVRIRIHELLAAGPKGVPASSQPASIMASQPGRNAPKKQ